MPHTFPVSSRRDGFTLVELSIVLVIVGLLVGGVFVGRALIRATELRNVAVEYQQYQTTVNAFNTRYRGLPGDLDRATKIWGEAPECDDWSNGPVSADRSTCNGDGSYTMVFTYPDSTTSDKESLLFWQHLSLSGMMEGKLDAYWGPELISGRSVPPSSLKSALWRVVHHTADDAGVFPAQRNKNLYRLVTAEGNAVMTTSEAFDVDEKIDDGNPGTGSVTIYPGDMADEECTVTSGGNPTSASDTGIRYGQSNDTVCSPLFVF